MLGKSTSLSSVLVTGGAGFIGSHLCEELLRNKIPVVILDNHNDFYTPSLKDANLQAVRATAEYSETSLKALKGDIRCAADLDRAFSALERPREAAVVHLAAMAGVRPSLENPSLYTDVNVAGTLQVLEACRRYEISRLAFASSSSVYGNNEKVPFAEEDRVDDPVSPYAATKKAGELLCSTYSGLYGISVAILRFFTVYGPRQRPDLAIHKFCRLLAAEKTIPFFGDGSTRRDYTYVSDTIQGVTGALSWLNSDAVARCEIFNLGESQTVSLNSLVELLSTEMGITPRLQRLPMQPGDVVCTFAAIEKARRILGYAPEVSINEGIPRFVAWFRRQQP